ncbi:hypothetical protein GOP47_0021308 [Adiantum capillus-veneris]|uniref:Uncharacterized protein n=1 Tax=Adiantum capillus-veneris TaxID=13818 RepID=A0A9D4UBU2_ADICA|nr:hypothetical protein GOP47_0021308 [Adiantum capillus-veneris]
MQTAKEAREARRKRILERGSDRLAYITGDTSKQHSLNASPTPPPQGAFSVAAETTAEEFGSGFHYSQNVQDFQQHVPDSQPVRTSSEPSGMMPAPLLSSRFLEEPMDTASTIASSSSDLPLARKEAKKCHTKYVKNIVHSIEKSENLRALAAALVAVYVVMERVLSCCGHSWGQTLAVLLPRWPLALVFVTELTIFIGAYFFYSQNKSSSKALDISLSQSEGLDDSFDKVSKALDVVGQFEDLLHLGLFCKKAAGAITLDCSIYAVTLVCGFSVCNYMFSCSRCY